MIKNKEKYFALLALTQKKGWMDSPETVQKVQNLGQSISNRPTGKFNFKRIKGVIVIDKYKNRRFYNTIEECIEKEKLSRGTVVRHLKQGTMSKDGRRFIVDQW